METLHLYEAQSGQPINKRKSLFYIFNKTAQSIVQEVENTTGFMRGNFPLTYLGCPIGHAKKKKVYYSQLIRRSKANCMYGREGCCLLEENQC